MKQWVTLLENAESLVPSSYIDRLVMEIHPREEDFHEGDLLHRIDRFLTYKKQTVSIDTLTLDEFDIDEDHVDDIVEAIESGKEISPIVYDPIDRSIIDGNHRANAYARLGYSAIPAYVGYEENEDWDEYEE